MPSAAHVACQHEALAPGERCPGCGRLQSYLAARGLLGPTPPTLERRVARAWARHPVVALLTHRRRLAFLRQLHALLKSGTGLPTVFAELVRYAPDAATREAVQRATERLAQGAGLAQALRGSESVLDDVTQELIAAAEEAGKLEPALERAIAQAEATQGLRWRAALAALYPAYLLAGLLVFGPLLELPGAIAAAQGATTGAAEAYGHALARNAFLGSLGLGLLFSAPLLVAALGIEVGWDRVRSHLPLIGRAYREVYRSRFASALGSGLGAGLGADKVLALACQAAGSPSVAARGPAAREAVRRGGTFADALATLELFEQAELGQLAIGERTGEMDRIATKLAEEHWETALRRIRIAALAVTGLMAVGFIGLVLVKVLKVLLGPIASYYNFNPGE